MVSGRKVVCIDEKLNMYEEDAGGVTLAYMKGSVPTLKILQQSSNDELGPELRAWHEKTLQEDNVAFFCYRISQFLLQPFNSKSALGGKSPPFAPHWCNGNIAGFH